MCYCKADADIEKFKEGFQETVSRGPDDSRIIELSDGIMGFHRLAIMGLHPEGMQPFEYEGDYVICNGEIYGFETIKKHLIADGYHFESDSDCEILLPMYKDYGISMFEMLQLFNEAIKQTYIDKWVDRNQNCTDFALGIQKAILGNDTEGYNWFLQ